MRTPKENLSHQKKEIISANAKRQARYAEKMRARGRKKLSLWVTSEEEQFIRAFILKYRKRREDLVPIDRAVSPGKPLHLSTELFGEVLLFLETRVAKQEKERG
jgi:hypothetical protein